MSIYLIHFQPSRQAVGVNAACFHVEISACCTSLYSFSYCTSCRYDGFGQVAQFAYRYPEFVEATLYQVCTKCEFGSIFCKCQ